MQDFIQYILSDFWRFAGFIIVLGSVLRFIMYIYTRAMRHRVLMKYGYPPAHLDADGDFLKKYKVDIKEETVDKLRFIYGRMVNVHSENPNSDYMQNFEDAINDVKDAAEQAKSY